MDVGDIEPGVDFEAAIADAVGQAEIVLALIGPRWMTASTPGGQRRLNDPDDYVATEIASALERDIRVIPVLLENTPMPSGEDLPERLRPLSRRNAIELSTVSWQRDVDALVAAIQRLTPARPATGVVSENGPAESSTPREVGELPSPSSDRHRRSRGGIILAALIGAALIIALAAVLNDGDKDGTTTTTNDTTTPPTNQAPIAISPEPIQMGCEEMVEIPLGGEDPDGGPIFFSIIRDPDEGRLENLQQTDMEATVQYWRRPAGEDDYQESFEFQVEDGEAGDTGTVEIDVACIA